MGAFRDFFTGLFGKIAEIPEKISELIVKTDFIVVFLGDRKEDVIEFFSGIKDYFRNGKKWFYVQTIKQFDSVSKLEKGWATMPENIKDDPDMIAVYEDRKEELAAQGYDTPLDRVFNPVAKGIKSGVKLVTDAALERLTPEFEGFMEERKIPEKDREHIREIAGSGEFGLNAVVAFMLGHFLSPILSTSLAPAWETMGQQAWKVLPNHLADVGTLIRLKYRGLITPEFYEDQLRKQGVGTEVQKAYEDGYLFYPAPTDLVMWLAKEVFEPDMIARYGLDAELPTGQLDLFEKAGVNIDQMTNYWRAHWEHPAWTVVSELLHRGQMTEAEVRDWFRLVEIPPFWRDKMMNVSWAVPTRVDVRRFWDMRTIDEPRMREIYEHRGYHGKDLDDYVLWTKVYTEFPSLMARYKNGWVTTEEVESELIALGMPPERAKTMIEEKIKKEAAGRTTKERDLTKAEIVKGVKKDVITLEQGQELLEDMGYDADEAEYIMLINIEAEKGSPESFWEFKKLTELEKLAEGKKGKRVPETLIEAEKKHRKHPERADLETEYREEMQKWEGEE